MPSAIDCATDSAESPLLFVPLRGEPFSADHLYEHFVELAYSIKVVTSDSQQPFDFAAEFEGDAERIAFAHSVVNQSARSGQVVPAEAEWLMDNFYIVEEQLREIRHDLPGSYYRELPKTENGKPRVYELARELIIHTDSSLDESMVERCVQHFQTVAPLTIGEVWAVPIMLRLVLVENLRRLCEQMLLTHDCRHSAQKMLDAWQTDQEFQIHSPTSMHCFPTIIQLFEQLPDRGLSHRPAIKVLERQLASRGWNLSELIHQEHQRQAVNQVSIGNVITSMRLIAGLDWVKFFESVNLVEQVLRNDPTHVYAQMDFASRDQYRHAVEELAKRTGRSDIDVSQLAIDQANSISRTDGQAQRQRHVGYWLIDDGRNELERRIRFRPSLGRMLQHGILQNPYLSYFGSLSLITVLIAAAFIAICWRLGMSLSLIVTLASLFVLPASELALSIVNLFITNVLPPRILPRLEFKLGVPNEYPTIVVVPSLLASNEEIDSLLDRLESHYLANSDTAILFALLTDFIDADVAETTTDPQLVSHAVAGIRRLNLRYQHSDRQPFYLFHRARKWNEAEQKWMGWERKRGKLMEFGKLLKGDKDTSYVVEEGDLSALEKFRQRNFTPFVITLDSDTQLPLGSARKLIGTLAHPLNRPQFSADRTRVTAGYTILQPRVDVDLSSASKSWFAKLFAGSSGVDPYATAASDAYQDLFGEGSFTGKGIYELHAFERALEGAFPENTILSHDLIEGCHARVGLVTNIEVFDGYPSRYDAETRRTHRWVRGDWQILPWLFPRVPYAAGWKSNPLSWLSRWKIFDNLRRSLVAPAMLLGLLLGWFVAPQHAWVWTLAAVAVLAFPLVAQLLMTIRSWPRKFNFFEHARIAGSVLLKTATQCLLAMVFLPHKAYLMADAVIRTLVRMFVTRRHMLEWQTAAAVEWQVSKSRWSIILNMWFVPAATIAFACTLPWSAWPAAMLLLIAWFASPWIALLISQPIEHKRVEYDESQKVWLRKIASETWAFFETFVGPQDHWLPVDNVQEEPHEKIAHRLSPTNEGLYLLSALTAHDLGLLGSHGLATLWENNLASMHKLEKLNGHFLNWYDTESLQPLHPRYVSTVDSGNLAACLLTMQEGVVDVVRAPLFGPPQFQGLRDSLDLLREAISKIAKDDSRDLQAFQSRVQEAIDILDTSLREVPPDPYAWAAVVSNLTNFINAIGSSQPTPRDEHSRHVLRKVFVVKRRIQSLCEDFELLLTPFNLAFWGESENHTNAWHDLKRLLSEQRSLTQIAKLTTTLGPLITIIQENNQSSEIEALRTAIESSASSAQRLIDRLEKVSTDAEGLALGMDFRFLFNPQRRLFSIGYNLEENRLDRSHYDMLCSEARLASHLAIAKGDVESSHWFHLGRHATLTTGGFALLSWGGTMFEYLMPPLFQRQYEGSLLTASCHGAVKRQQEYCRSKNVPWGISESAFGAVAVNLDYHYRSFGVPGLGLKRGLAKDLVISPYSSILALGVDPAASINNLQMLVKEGARGDWGFYDALDYTPERVPFGKRRIVVRCFMAHHQGMSILALNNLLTSGNIERRFSAHPLARATELLLQERLPSSMIPFEQHEEEPDGSDLPHQEQQLVSRRLSGWQNPSPRTHLLSNGLYSVMLSNSGGGYSRCRDLDVTRWRSDTTLDHWGQFIYVREMDSGIVWSPTYQPTCTTLDSYETIFAIDKVEFHRRQGELETLLEVAVSPENNAEVRQLRIINHGHKTRQVQLTSFAEIALNSSAADLAHPAFQKLFLETEYIKEESAIIARRRPRDSKQKAQYAVHVLAAPSAIQGTIEFETSRQAFIGRRRNAREPQAVYTEHLSGTAGAVLDPVFALRCTVSVPPGESVVVAFSTAIAESREEALALADQYHELRSVQRVFELAWAYTQVELRHQHLTPGQIHLFQRLSSHLIYPNRSMRGDSAVLVTNRLGQNGLWRHGISGDLPVLLARVTEPEHVAFVRELLLAHRFWRDRGFSTDLVVINDYPGSYFDSLQDQLVALLQEIKPTLSDKPGNVFLLRGPHLTTEEQTLFETVARCVLHGDRGSLAQQIDSANQEASKTAVYAPPRDRLSSVMPAAVRSIESTNSEPLEYWNGYGGFAEDGVEYRIHVQPNRLPPMPWSHVVANPRLGFVVTESGGGYTWFENSRENKLTTWSNDPVADPPSEVLYVSDDATGELWLPMSRKSIDRNEAWVHYGAGYAKYFRESADLSQEVMLTVDKTAPLKFVRIKLTNRGGSRRTLKVSYYLELVLGVAREQTNLHLQSSFDDEVQSLLFRNRYHPEYSQQVGFLKVLGRTSGYTADRGEFIGRNGSWETPVALASGSLQGRVGVGLDPCGVVQTQVILEPQQSAEIIFLVGAGVDETEALEILKTFSSPEQIASATKESLADWNDILTTIQVKTPNRALDLLANRWLLYQTLCCRMWARSAFYQSGGAYGFRDQLQDSMAVVYSRPQFVREHLLRAAARQYRQGDVQHWWHPPLGKGTRTRFSDDLLWLPLVVAHYVTVTGDRSVLDELVPFLESPLLQPEEQERYEQPKVSTESASIYTHCLRAIHHGMRFGSHGLPLMGCGDWNDGMNKVGAGGTGESVWVGWFLLVLIEQFKPHMLERQDTESAEALEAIAEQLRSAIEQNAWDGAWYRRAYFDDGEPLGSALNDECQIDSLVQSWAVFAKGDPDRAREGMTAATERLVSFKDGIVRLFDPPFDRGKQDPGYIKGYLPGIRENGGQYTHAAIWMVQALAEMGEINQAMRVLDLINPILHGQDEDAVSVYQVEPYVMAADVYGVAPHNGRGGWTWYTGSSAWIYRVIIEKMLGMKCIEGVYTLKPKVPSDWEQYEIIVRNTEGESTLQYVRSKDARRLETQSSLPYLSSLGQDHE